MNSDGTDFQSQFSSGFSTTSTDLGGSLLALAFILVFVGALVWFFFDQYRKNKAREIQKTPAAQPGLPPKQTFAKLRPLRRRINPLQQQIIYDIIDEFRKQETMAQAIPAAVLEKYSEFFFQHANRLNTGAGAARDFVRRNYPLREGYAVEMDFHTPGSNYLIRSKVVTLAGKTMTVLFTSEIPPFLKKGMPLLLNYSVGKHFLQGTSSVADIRPRQGLVLARPSQVTLNSERRYVRAAVKSLAAAVTDGVTGSRSLVKVQDLSLEGVRIQVDKQLEKNRAYQLTFDAETAAKRWHFGPLECVPSKTFTTGSGTVECGLVFLYLDMDTKAHLQSFMRHTAQELQEGEARR